MIPKRIELTNFLSFGEGPPGENGKPTPGAVVEFTDDEPLWVVGGPNGVGKSAVFDAMTYCLFGAHRGGAREIDPLVRHGANGFSVSFEFGFGGVDYRVTRNRAGSRTAQAVEQRQPGAGKWERVPNVNSVPDVRAWAERTLGLGFEAFKASVLLRQGEADAILTAGGTERQKILKKIIGAERYEELSKRVHDSARGKDDELKRLKQVRENTPVVTEEQLTAARTAAAAAEEARTQAEAGRSEAAGRVGLAKQWAALGEKRHQLAEKIAAADARADAAEHIRRDKARLDELSAVLPTVAQLVPLRDALGGAERRLLEVRGKHTGSAADEKRLTDRCEGLRLRTATHRDTAADHAKRATELRAEIGRQEKFLTTADAIADLDTQLGRFEPSLDARYEAAEQGHAAAIGAERAASYALTEITTLLGQAKKDQAQFGSLEVGVKCSRCGQTVSPEHAELERKRIADAVAELTRRHTEAKEAAATAANALEVAEAEKNALAKRVAERTRLRQRRDDRQRTLETLGGTADAARLREEIARLTADAAALEQRRDAERAAQTAAEGELKAADGQLAAVAAERAKLADDLATLNNQVARDSERFHTLSATVPDAWRDITPEHLAGCRDDLNRLKTAGVAEQFRRLEEDAARRGEWVAQREEVEKQIADIPSDAHIPVADAEKAAAAARVGFDQADRHCQEARDALSELVRQAERFEKLKQDIAAAEAAARVHGKLDDLLGRTGLQRQLVADAEREIVRLAHDTVHNLSGGDLSIELDDSERREDEALALRVRRADDPTPIGVLYLSGSQRFRVAISVALAIGRFAAGQARPLECVIIDEGFGSLDKDGLRAAAEELNRLRQYLRRIILVSHQEEFTEQFPVVIRLSRGEAGTTAEKVRR